MLTFAIVTSLNGKGSQNSDTLEVKSESLYYFKGFWRMLFFLCLPKWWSDQYYFTPHYKGGFKKGAEQLAIGQN